MAGKSKTAWLPLLNAMKDKYLRNEKFGKES